MPQGQHRTAQRLLAERRLLGCERDAIALGQQLGDLHLAVDRALAPHLGWMGGQHRSDLGRGEKGLKPAAGDARLLGTRERVGHGALARCRSGERMRSGATDMMLVLGNVGQVREEAVGANDVNGLAARQAVQRGFELAPRRVVLAAMEANGGLANALDDPEDRLALLLADGVAENPAEQADVVAQRKVFFRNFDRVEACHGHLTSPLLINFLRVREDGEAVGRRNARDWYHNICAHRLYSCWEACVNRSTSYLTREKNGEGQRESDSEIRSVTVFIAQGKVSGHP